MTALTLSEPAAASRTPLLSGVGLSVRYGQVSVLTDVNLTVHSGAELAITGRSGSGKTTLLLVLAGLLQHQRGSLRWPALATSSAARRSEIGMVFQAPSLVPELTAAENVSLPLRLRGSDVRQAAQATDEALSLVGLQEAADALPSQLSGGMQQRVAIARVLAGRPRLILADEPTGALDRENAFAALAALRDAVAVTGGALVVATHDDELAGLLSEQAVLDGGRLHAPAKT